MPIAARAEPSFVHMSLGHVFRASVILGDEAVFNIAGTGSQMNMCCRMIVGVDVLEAFSPPSRSPTQNPKMNAVVSQRATPLKVRILGSPNPAPLAEDSDPLDSHRLTGSPAHRLTGSPAHRLTGSPIHRLTSR